MASWRDVDVPPRIRRRPTEARGYPVPYVATTEAEATPPPGFRLGTRHDGPLEGLRLVTARPAWERKRPEANRGGLPILGRMNEDRQRDCMLTPRCQVCAYQLPQRGPWLFIAGAPVEDGGTGGAPYRKLGLAMREPAVCTPCARYALQVCPGLVGGHRKSGDLTVYTTTRWTPHVEVVLPGRRLDGRVEQRASTVDAVRQAQLAGLQVAVVFVLAVLHDYTVEGRDAFLARTAP